MANMVGQMAAFLSLNGTQFTRSLAAAAAQVTAFSRALGGVRVSAAASNLGMGGLLATAIATGATWKGAGGVFVAANKGIVAGIGKATGAAVGFLGTLGKIGGLAAAVLPGIGAAVAVVAASGVAALSQVTRLVVWLTGRLYALAKTAAMAGAALYAAFAVVGIHAGVRLEQNIAALEVLLKSAAKAKTLLAGLESFAAATPFAQNEIQHAGKQLLAYGFAAENVVPTIRMIGDVSSATEIPLSELAYLYGTVRTQNRLFQRDLWQFTNRGIPLTEELAKNMGKTNAQIMEMVTAGGIGFTEVQQAFKTMTATGGRFGGLTDKMARTLAGRWAKLKDDLMFAARDVMGAFMPMLKSLVSYAAANIPTLKNIAEAITERVLAFARAVQSAWPTIVGVVKTLNMGFWNLYATLKSAALGLWDWVSGFFDVKAAGEQVLMVIGNIPLYASLAFLTVVRKFSWLVDAVQTGAGLLANVLANPWEYMKSLALGAFKMIPAAFRVAWNVVTDSRLWWGLVDVILSPVKFIWETLKSIGTNFQLIVSAITKTASGDFAGAAADLGKAFVTGFTAVPQALWKSSEGFRNTVAMVADEAGKEFGKVWNDSLGQFVPKNTTPFSDKLDGMIDRLDSQRHDYEERWKRMWKDPLAGLKSPGQQAAQDWGEAREQVESTAESIRRLMGIEMDPFKWVLNMAAGSGMSRGPVPAAGLGNSQLADLLAEARAIRQTLAGGGGGVQLNI